MSLKNEPIKKDVELDETMVQFILDCVDTHLRTHGRQVVMNAAVLEQHLKEQWSNNAAKEDGEKPT